MKRLSLLVAFVALMAPAAFARPLPVQSGEHPEFTRLVVLFKGSEWTVVQTGRKVVMRYEGFEDGFDIDRVFDFIPRNRIAEVSVYASEMELTLGCDCAVSAFLEAENYVVIDVAATADQLINAALTPENTETTEPAETTDIVADVETPSAPARNLPDVADLLAVRDTLPNGSLQVIENLQSRLDSELKSATQRGVLSAVPAPFDIGAQQRPQVDTSAFLDQTEPAQPPLEPEPKDTPLANLRITTSRDIPETFRSLAEITSTRGQVCPPENAMALYFWGDNRPFSDQLAESRQGLYGEFDKVDAKAAIKLAQTYLFFGFGAEARSVLNLDPTVAQEMPHLLTMARILDGEAPDPNNTIRGLAECQDDTALWAFLAEPIPVSGSLPPSEGALRGLNSLPAHLRVLIAPKLNAALLAYGDPEGAATALRSLERLGQELPPEVTFARAKTDLVNGEPEKSVEQLTEVIDKNVAKSPEALIALVEVSRQTGQPITAETAKLIEAYAHEMKGGPLGPGLQRAHVIALVESGLFDRAFAENAKLYDEESVHTDRALFGYMMGRLVSSASDVVFLEHVFEASRQDIEALSDKDTAALSERFLDLGFAVNAENALANVPDAKRDTDQKLLAARISIALGKPAKAQATLIGIETPEADLLRAEAKRLAGDNDGAHALYAQIDRPQEAAETAWLSDDWRGLTAPDVPVFGPTATLASTQEPAEEIGGMLTRSATLLEQSSLTRKTLQELLGSGDLQVAVPTE